MANKPTGRKRGRPTKSSLETSNPNMLVKYSNIPEPPILGQDGLKLWNQIWIAGENWLREEHDSELIIQACQIKDEIEQMRRALAIGEVNRVYIASNRQPTTHPYVNQIAAGRAMLVSILATLGLGPESRTRLGLVETKTRSILSDLKEASLKRQEEMKNENE